MPRAKTRTCTLLLIAIGALLAAACSSSDAPSPGKAGGAVVGEADNHCVDDAGAPVNQETSQSACAAPDGGIADDGGDVEPYGATRFNQEADDDDCKYHVKWTSTPVYRNKNVTFTVEATRRVDGQPLTGAYPRLEVYLDDTHPAPNTPQKPNEISPGKYSVGPIKFDAAGQWTARFHFYEDCVDLTEDSPHGHVAFFVDVP